MKAIADRISAFRGWITRHRVLLGALTALAMAALLAVYHVSSGPLENMNDIGGWTNRAMFIAMTAAVHAGVLIACAALSRCSFARVVLRQAILTAGLYIMLLAINQKTYAYVQVMLPAVRAMQSGGFAAGMALETGLSAFALTMLRLLSATPVYPMYMMKLLAIASMLSICLMMMRAAERNGLGIRTEVLLALCVILPQGFMNAAATALTDVTAVALMMGALTLYFGCDNPKKIAAAAAYGLACAVSGVCLYALPVFALAAYRDRGFKKTVPVFVLVWIGAALPAVIGGAPVLSALSGLVHANFAAPAYASGSVGVFNVIPRALATEIAQYAATLRHLPALDLATHNQEFYTQEHFVIVTRGVMLAGLAAYTGALALMYRSEKPMFERTLVLVLAALIVCPGATSGAWLLCDVLCLYAILAQPKLRLPACLALFATAAGSCYPMTEEVMLPMVYAFALALCALLMLLGVVPNGREEKNHE